MCVLDGTIFVYEGILKFVENEDMLAGILAHEISHAYCRHQVHYFSTKLTTLILWNMFIYLLFGSLNVQDLANRLINLKMSRQHELEADDCGVMLMCKAGYDPNKLAEFFKTPQENYDKIIELFSTHPNDINRYQRILNMEKPEVAKIPEREEIKNKFIQMKKELMRKELLANIPSIKDQQ